MGKKSNELRGALKRAGISYELGFICGTGKRVNIDNVTCAYRVPGDPMTSITFEEDEDGALWAADALEVWQAVAAVVGVGLGTCQIVDRGRDYRRKGGGVRHVANWRCSECGAPYHDGTNFCGNCGRRIAHVPVGGGAE